MQFKVVLFQGSAVLGYLSKRYLTQNIFNGSADKDMRKS